jgi:pimeloyl-ACP methyl ester carboxylesterase
MLERYAAGGGSVRELVFEGCGHCPPLERSAEVREQLLAQIEGAA